MGRSVSTPKPLRLVSTPKPSRLLSTPKPSRLLSTRKTSRLFSALTETPAWMALPPMLVAAAIAWAVGGYEPVVFDASLYDTADADEATLFDADGGSEALDDSDGGSVERASAAVAGELVDGTYVGYAVCGEGNDDGWKPYYVAVTVTVADGAVASIDDVGGSPTARDGDATLTWDAAENEAYLTLAISGRKLAGTPYAGVVSQIEDAIDAGTTPGSIDVVSGATYSSEAIFESFWDALDEAGSTTPAATQAASTTIAAAVSRAVALSGGSVTAGTLADGTWTGYAPCGKTNTDGWKPYYVAVTVRVAGGEVRAIKRVAGTSTGGEGDEELSWDASENQAYLTWAISGRTRGGVAYEGVVTQLRAAIAKGATPGSVDVVSGATYSSVAIYNAYIDALGLSAAAAGSSLEVSDADATASDATGGSSDAGDSADADDSDADDSGETGVSALTEALAGVTLVDGTYAGAGLCQDGGGDGWSSYYVIVTISVSDAAVSGIVGIKGDSTDSLGTGLTYDASENSTYFSWAVSGRGLTIKGMKAKIEALISAGTPGEVTTSSPDVVSGATWTSGGIRMAYIAAVEQAIEVASSAASGADVGAADDGTVDYSSTPKIYVGQ